MQVLPRDFLEIEPYLNDPLGSDMYRFATLGLLSSQEQFQILSDWNKYSTAFLDSEDEVRDEVYRKLSEYGFGVKGNFFIEFPVKPQYRHWFEDNLVLTKNEVIWGEELGFYEQDDVCVAKSVINNTNLVWLPENKEGYSIIPYVLGGIELTGTRYQLTSKQDIMERFKIDLPCDTVVVIR